MIIGKVNLGTTQKTACPGFCFDDAENTLFELQITCSFGSFSMRSLMAPQMRRGRMAVYNIHVLSVRRLIQMMFVGRTTEAWGGGLCGPVTR